MDQAKALADEARARLVALNAVELTKNSLSYATLVAMHTAL